jgi:poly-gamma-glutamate capsule biosynthesis protein CapA/YwtB (metallophosphatase superfamily)
MHIDIAEKIKTGAVWGMIFRASEKLNRLYCTFFICICCSSLLQSRPAEAIRANTSHNNVSNSLPGTEEYSDIKNDKMYTLFAAGDTMIARWMHYWYYEKGPDFMLGEVKEMVSKADIAMTNLECVVSTRGDFFDKGEMRPYLYRARPEMLDILTNAGFDLVVTTNNHSMDYGPEALLEQMELLNSVGIAYVGSGRNLEEASSPTYIRVDNIIIAFIGMETSFPECAAQAQRAGVLHAKGKENIIKELAGPVAEAKRNADIVVFTPHWGRNWTDKPTNERIELAHSIIDMGVDAILGHSSHHVHGIEVYKGKPIIYDMGSFLFDRVGQGRMRYSAGFILEFNQQGFYRISIYPLRLYDCRTTLAEKKDTASFCKLLVNLTRQLNTDLKLTRDGDVLRLELPPGKNLNSRVTPPNKLFDSNRTTKLQDIYRQRKTNVVHDKPPYPSKDFNPVEIESGITVIDAKLPGTVKPRYGFKAEVLLKVSKPLKGRWTGCIKARKSDNTDGFVWRYPFSDGGWLPCLWGEGQVVSDRTFVRPPLITEGVYELYWRLENSDAQTCLIPLDKEYQNDEGFIPIGKISVTSGQVETHP